MLINILGMCADNDLILTAGLQDLDDSGHLFNFLCNGLVGGPLQHQAKSGGAVGRGDDVAFADGILDIGGKPGIVTNFFCHLVFPPLL